MIYTKEVIRSILSTHLLQGIEIFQDERAQVSPEDLITHIVAELNGMEDIKVCLKRVSDHEIAAKADYDETMQLLADERVQIQGECNHHHRVVDDPSLTDRSDDGVICVICGARQR